MNEYYLPYDSSTGTYPSITTRDEEVQLLTSAIIVGGRMVLLGNIGKTSCCGSAYVLGIYPTQKNDLIELIRRTRYSIFYFPGNWWNLRENEIAKELNKNLNGIVEISFHKTNEGLFMFVDILDVDKYWEWIE